MKTIEVTFKIIIEDNVNVEELISELDYSIEYPGIVDSELVDYKGQE